MKNRSFLLILLVFACIPGQAQTSELEYWPFAQDGKYWHCQVGGIKENIYESEIDGDTLIDGEIWMKVYNRVTARKYYYAAVRDVDRKVYAIAKGSTKPRLLYDFNLKEGDIVKCGMEGNMFCCLRESGEQMDSLLGYPVNTYLKVERIDTITDLDLRHRVFIFTLLDTFRYPFLDRGNGALRNNVIWVEGIGSYNGPFTPWMPLSPYNFMTRNCQINKTYIFSYPYPIEGEDGVDETESISSYHHATDNGGTVYNLQGIQLTSPPEKGIYIENGKKRMVK
jgi:hypothetical protein